MSWVYFGKMGHTNKQVAPFPFIVRKGFHNRRRSRTRVPSVGEIISVLEVILGGLWRSFWVSLGRPLGGRSGRLSEVVVGVSGEPLGGRLELCEGAHVERMLASLSLWVSLGGLLEVDLGLVKVSMLSGC